MLADLRDGPFHVGVLLDNVPSSPCASARPLAGATVVGVNPTRRGGAGPRRPRRPGSSSPKESTVHSFDGLDTGVGAERSSTPTTQRSPTTGCIRPRECPRSRSTPQRPSCSSSPQGTSGAPRRSSSPSLDCDGRHQAQRGMRPGSGRRDLRGDAALPLQRALRRLVTVRGRRCGARPPPEVSRRRASCPTFGASAPPTSTTWASRLPTSSPPPSSPTTPTTR